MRLSCLTAAILGDALFPAVRPVVADSDAHALWIQPSGNWLGIDGDWSTFNFILGSPAQHVELTVSTALSEVWVVENFGCSTNQLCYNARGGVFFPSASQSWESLGPWQLGLKDLPYGGNGDYGLESLAFTDTLRSATTLVNSALIAAINATEYYQGYIGLGIAQGRLGKNVTNPLLTQLVETYGYVPSHSYGYTAGSFHAGKMPGSLTLGGYDANRFKPHDVNFDLNPNDRIPSVNLRGITATVPTLETAPASNWTSTSQPLLGMNESVTAVIDTSTPYLWLPTAVCERFARYLDLQWNETLGVYVFRDGSQFTQYTASPPSPLSFTFSISSYDYLDNFAQPLALPGVVNITVPAAAFAQLLRYPFANVIQFSDSSVPYFPLKRAAAGGPYILGRAFMQAAYMIMNYETAQFSIHEAAFPSNPNTNLSIVTIAQSPTSPYPTHVELIKGKGLTNPQIAGMVVGIVLVGSVVLITTYVCCRRRRTRKANAEAAQEEEVKDDSESVESGLPRSPVRRMLSVMIRRKKSKKPVVHEVHGQDRQMAEVGADASHEVYELPVPLEPVELDSSEGTDDVTELGTEGSQGMSAYEQARRKLEMQLQGPVPTYTPPPTEKTMQDISPVAHYRPSDEPSPASSPTYANTNSLPNSLPSPMSPHPAEWTNRHFDFPSPMTNRHFDFPSPVTVVPPLPSPPCPGTNSNPSATISTRSAQSPTSPNSLHSCPSMPEVSVSRSNSADVSPVSPVGGTIPIPPSPSNMQRTPIDPARVICLGPLPENVQLPRHHPSIPRLILPDGRALDPGPTSVGPGHSPSPLQPPHSSNHHHRRRSTSTLGSNYTVDEEMQIHNSDPSRDGSTRQHRHDHADEPHQEEQSDDYPRSPLSMERIDGGSELVHVPQLADKRYSWEEDDHR